MDIYCQTLCSVDRSLAIKCQQHFHAPHQVLIVHAAMLISLTENAVSGFWAVRYFPSSSSEQRKASVSSAQTRVGVLPHSWDDGKLHMGCPVGFEKIGPFFLSMTVVALVVKAKGELLKGERV